MAISFVSSFNTCSLDRSTTIAICLCLTRALSLIYLLFSIKAYLCEGLVYVATFSIFRVSNCSRCFGFVANRIYLTAIFKHRYMKLKKKSKVFTDFSKCVSIALEILSFRK